MGQHRMDRQYHKKKYNFFSERHQASFGVVTAETNSIYLRFLPWLLIVHDWTVYDVFAQENHLITLRHLFESGPVMFVTIIDDLWLQYSMRQNYPLW